MSALPRALRPCPVCGHEFDIPAPTMSQVPEGGSIDGLAAVFGMPGSAFAALHDHQMALGLEREVETHLASHGWREWFEMLTKANDALLAQMAMWSEFQAATK